MASCPITLRDGEYVRLVKRERYAERGGEELPDELPTLPGELHQWLR